MSRLFASLLGLGIVSASAARAEWALIDALRTEPPAPVQRVAFVGPAVVLSTKGKAERLCGVECWSPLANGTNLQPGDLIRTQNGSVIVKMTQSQSLVKITPNTILRLVPFEAKWDRAALTGCEEQTGFVVRSCRGTALYRAQNEDWTPVHVNSVLPENAIIRTEGRTTVDLFAISAHRPLRIEGAKEVNLARAKPQPTRGAALAALTR